MYSSEIWSYAWAHGRGWIGWMAYVSANFCTSDRISLIFTVDEDKKGSKKASHQAVVS